MSEKILVIHDRYNPATGKGGIVVGVSGLRERNLRLNGKKPLQHTSLNGSTELALQSMMVVGGAEAKLPNDMKGKPQNRLRIYPGEIVSLRFERGLVIHTVATANSPEQALEILKKIKSQRLQ